MAPRRSTTEEAIHGLRPGIDSLSLRQGLSVVLPAVALLAACAVPPADKAEPTGEPYDHYHPSWSPDGRRIAFDRYYRDESGRYHGGHLFVINVDARELMQLTDGDSWDGHPAWSLDSQRIWFQSDRSGEEALHWIPAEGGEAVKAASLGTGGAVAVSPDGRSAAYYSDKDGDSEIYIVDLESSEETKLTDNEHPDYNPRWHPDGRSITFHSVVDGEGVPMVMQTDGQGARRLTDGPGEDVVYSPDGSQIAFNSDRDGGSNVYTMDADGSNVRQVTNTDGRNFSPSWSPDGKSVAFVSDRHGRHEIFLARVDGSVIFRLTGKISRRAAFLPDEYEPYGRPGTAVIEGRAYLRMKSGETRNCPEGATVFMNPVTTYSTEWYERNVIDREELEPSDRRSSTYHRITKADENGHFRFEGLPAGDYYFGCRVIPEEGFAHARASVRDGEVVEADATREVGY